MEIPIISLTQGLHCQVRVDSGYDRVGMPIIWHRTKHSDDAAKCQCRQHPNSEQQAANDKVLCEHLYELLESDTIDIIEMTTIFGKIKLGERIHPKVRLLWDEERKVWITPAQPEQGQQAQGQQS
ncbi:hypothetical protein GGS24DRAFT_500716 [Hypoxylon argillaceum]|nr:hypothetical protein GGS24DRAFT_500716 [Hypoxylon argillaceum]KAI1156295.1 hypothetical protein F4825DRAFT_476236 [Nemania diffusa]